MTGFQRRGAECVIGEIGADMTRFATARHLASWAGRCPGNDKSAGKRRSGKTRDGSKWLDFALEEAAMAAIRVKGHYLEAQYRRLKPRRGHKRALGAVKHSDIFVVNVDDLLAGTEQPTNITNTPDKVDDDADWSPTGHIVYTAHNVGGDMHGSMRRREATRTSRLRPRGPWTPPADPTNSTLQRPRVAPTEALLLSPARSTRRVTRASAAWRDEEHSLAEGPRLPTGVSVMP
jgi:hypothetical protein